MKTLERMRGNVLCHVIFLCLCLLQAQRMYPWRSFIACHGLLPLHVWDVPPTEHCMQVHHLICFFFFFHLLMVLMRLGRFGLVYESCFQPKIYFAINMS